MKSRKSSAASGLLLPRFVLGVLRQRGIFARPSLGVQYQHLARRYVLRGVESGGAVGDVGHYVTFARDDGQPLEYLYPVESIGVNGPHSVVIAANMVRIEMLRKAKTYELVITQHRPQSVLDGKKPALESKTLFRGIHGRLELDLVGLDKGRGGSVVPIFYTMAGEPMGIPRRYRNAVRAVTQAVNCIGCSHSHYLRSAKTEMVEENAVKSIVTASAASRAA